MEVTQLVGVNFLLPPLYGFLVIELELSGLVTSALTSRAILPVQHLKEDNIYLFCTDILFQERFEPDIRNIKDT